MLNQRRNRLVIISGTTAAGKNTIIGKLKKRNPNKIFVVPSVTTRPRREDEDEGNNRIFVEEAEFAAMIKRGEFVEYAKPHGTYSYGKRKKDIDRALEKGITIMEINIDGFDKLKKIYGGEILSIFIEAPSIEELRRRLKKRGVDSSAEIEKRLKNSLPKELAHKKYYDYVVVNSVLEDAVNETEKIIFDL